MLFGKKVNLCTKLSYYSGSFQISEILEVGVGKYWLHIWSSTWASEGKTIVISPMARQLQ